MDDFYIEISDEKIFVSEEIYKAYNQSKWREEKVFNREKSKRIKKNIYAQNLCLDTMEEIIMKKISIDELNAAIKKLNYDEQILIKIIFYTEMTEREAAKNLGISRNTIHSKKAQIIAKLRRLLDDFQ